MYRCCDSNNALFYEAFYIVAHSCAKEDFLFTHALVEQTHQSANELNFIDKPGAELGLG